PAGRASVRIDHARQRRVAPGARQARVRARRDARGARVRRGRRRRCPPPRPLDVRAPAWRGDGAGPDRDAIVGPMLLTSAVLTGVVAALHLYFLVLEMFLWTTPLGQKVFGRTAAEQRETK